VDVAAARGCAKAQALPAEPRFFRRSRKYAHFNAYQQYPLHSRADTLACVFAAGN